VLISDLDPIRRKLGELVSQVLEGELGTAPSWHGAGVFITDRTSPPPQPDNSCAPSRTVVTRFVVELSWLFERLHDAFAWPGFRIPHPTVPGLASC
jgi:hypothetical protein